MLTKTTVPPQVAKSRKAASLKEANAKRRELARATSKKIAADNLRAQVAAEAFTEKLKLSPPPPPEQPIRLLSKRQVEERVQLSFPTIWELVRKGQFPLAHYTAVNRTVFFEHEINEWIRNLPVRHYRGPVR